MNIHEVAKAAGVSIATVSRVVNHPESVAEKTRDKVLAVMSTAGFTKKDYRTKIGGALTYIGVIVPSIEEYPHLMEGIQAVADVKNIAIQLSIYNYDTASFTRCIHTAIALGVDGVIVALGNENSAALHLLKDAGISYVCIAGKRSADCGDLCYINYNESAEKLAEYLLELGCKQIAVVTSHQNSDQKTSLIEGFDKIWMRELPENHLDFFDVGESIKDGFLFAEHYLIDLNNRPDAIVCQNDKTAAGVIKASAKNGIRIPEDIRVVGFNDDAISVAISPELTTVEHPTMRLGTVAIRRLIDIAEESEFFDIESQEICLKSRLKIRKSCGNQKTIYELYE